MLTSDVLSFYLVTFRMDNMKYSAQQPVSDARPWNAPPPRPVIFGRDLKQLAKDLNKQYNTCIVQIQDERSFMTTINEVSAQSSNMEDLRKNLYERQTADLAAAWNEFLDSGYDMRGRKSQFPYYESWASARNVYIARSVLMTLRYFGIENPHGWRSLLKPKRPLFQFPVPSPSPPPTSTSTSKKSFVHTPPSSVRPVSLPKRKCDIIRAEKVGRGRITKKTIIKGKETGSRQARSYRMKDYWRNRKRSKTGTI